MTDTPEHDPAVPRPDVVLPPDLADEAAELVRLVGRLIDGTEATNQQLAQLALRGRRDRLVLWLLGVALVGVVALGVGMGVAVHRANDAADAARDATQQYRELASSNAKAIIEGCEANNRTRKANIELWEGVLSLNTNPDAVARRDAQLALVRKTFTPRDCSPEALGVAR